MTSAAKKMEEGVQVMAQPTKRVNKGVGKKPQFRTVGMQSTKPHSAQGMKVHRFGLGAYRVVLERR